MIVSQRCIPTDPQTVQAVLANWREQWPDMGVLALLPEAEKGQLAALQSIFRTQSVPVVGGIFPALVTDEGFVTEGVWLICMNPMPACFLIDDLAQDGVQRMADAVNEVVAQSKVAARSCAKMGTVFMVFDGMIPNIGTLLSELHLLVSGAINFGGVNAGSETFQPMPCLFDADRLVGHGVLGLVLPTGAEVLARHGYPVSKCLMKATSSTGNRIETIDHRPAFDVYQQVICEEYGVALTRENFYDYAVHFPFGVVMAVDVLVRIPVALTDDGSLFCVGEVPSNSLLRLLKAPLLEDSDCVSSLVQGLKERENATSMSALFAFYCAGRRMHFGPHADAEITQLRVLTGANTVFGALTLGEFDTVEDLNLPRFHNAAVVCLAY